MNEPSNHPQRFMRLLKAFCPDYLFEEIEGDLIQRFNRDMKSFGERRARNRLAWNVVRFFRPGIILRNRFTPPIIDTIMLRNYFKMSWRSLAAHKGNSLINIFGLVVGIATALVILSIIRYELGFDSFHSNADRTYRVVTISQHDDGQKYSPGVAYPLSDALKTGIPAADHITALHYQRELQVDVLDPKGMAVKKFQESNGCALVEPSFFQVFDFKGTGFKWISGNPETALSEPFSIVLTRSMAHKYFSTLDVLDRALKVEQQLDFKVTGVIEDLPPNSDFPFKVLLSYSTFYKIQENEMKNDWRSVANVNQCFITLPELADRAEVEDQIHRIYAAHVPEEVSRSQKFKLQPLSEIHQDDRFGNFNLRTVSKSTVWTLSIAGIVLLIIACINYINLTTARSTLRSKEIGIRKVLGSRRRQLIFQFLSEAFLVTFFASAMALVTAQLIIIQIEPLIDIHIEHYLFLDLFILKSLLVLLFIITLTAGFYPALMISGFHPLNAIKNKLSAPGRSAHLRKSLVVLQFTVTQVFIIGTFVVLSQMDYFRNVDLGFQKEGIINVNLAIDYQSKIQTLKNRIQAIATISEVSISSTTPSGLRRALWTTGIRRKEADSQSGTACEYQSIDAGYLDLYGIELIAGRNFTPQDSVGYLIINQTLAFESGFRNPEKAVGEEMVLDGKNYTVIGVVKDYHSRSLKEGLDKIAFAVHPHMYRLASIKLNLPDGADNTSVLLQSTISQLESVWTTIFPETAFDYRFLDENIKLFYEQEAKTSKLLQIFSAVLLITGCLGLYGLISFVVARKLKEVAVRKIFGASMLQVMALISKDYLKLVVVAFALAVPVACYFLQHWLDTFAYRIKISWWVVLLPGVLVLMVAFIAVSGELLRAARSNPANTLKSE